MSRFVSRLIIGGLLSAIPLACVGQESVVTRSELLVADSPRTTVLGNKFIAPEGWTISVRGPATILEVPEGGSWIALVDVQATDGDAAVAAGWAAYREINRPLKVASDLPP